MELLIALDRTSARPLQVQLYEEMRRLILGGVLKPGQRLPSSRQVADQLAVARNTVVLSYDRLILEGYVTSRLKAGLFVNDSLPDASVLVRNGHAAVSAVKDRVRLGKIPPFSGRSPDLWRDQQMRPQLDLFVGPTSPRFE